MLNLNIIECIGILISMPFREANQSQPMTNYDQEGYFPAGADVGETIVNRQRVPRAKTNFGLGAQMKWLHKTFKRIKEYATKLGKGYFYFLFTMFILMMFPAMLVRIIF